MCLLWNPPECCMKTSAIITSKNTTFEFLFQIHEREVHWTYNIWNHALLNYELCFSILTILTGSFRAQCFPCPALCSTPIPGLALKPERHAVWEQETERVREKVFVLEVRERETHWGTWLWREREKGDCKSKTNSKALTGKRRRPAVAGLQGGPERAFFNADTCKPLRQDLQCRKQRLWPCREREPPWPEHVL